MPDVMHQGSESQLLNVVFWYLIDSNEKHMAIIIFLLMPYRIQA